MSCARVLIELSGFLTSCCDRGGRFAEVRQVFLLQERFLEANLLVDHAASLNRMGNLTAEAEQNRLILVEVDAR